MLKSGLLVGLLANGRGCGYPNKTSIFVDVPETRSFLINVTGQDV